MARDKNEKQLAGENILDYRHKSVSRLNIPPAGRSTLPTTRIFPQFFGSTPKARPIGFGNFSTRQDRANLSSMSWISSRKRRQSDRLQRE